jgi:hypothetical protein
MNFITRFGSRRRGPLSDRRSGDELFDREGRSTAEYDETERFLASNASEYIVTDFDDGDIIFVSRPCACQSLLELAGDPWRHVGITVEVDGVMSIAEVAGSRFQASAASGNVGGARPPARGWGLF